MLDRGGKECFVIEQEEKTRPAGSLTGHQTLWTRDCWEPRQHSPPSSLIMHAKSNNLRRKSIEHFGREDNFPFADTDLTFKSVGIWRIKVLKYFHLKSVLEMIM